MSHLGHRSIPHCINSQNVMLGIKFSCKWINGNEGIRRQGSVEVHYEQKFLMRVISTGWRPLNVSRYSIIVMIYFPII